MKIKSFTRAICKDIGSEMAAAMQDIAKKYGVSIERGTGRFSDDDYTVKFVARVAVKATALNVDSGGVGGFAAATPSAVVFMKNAKKFGLSPDDMGRTFNSVRSGRQLQIIGMKITRVQCWILVEGVKGGKWRLHVEDVVAALSR